MEREWKILLIDDDEEDYLLTRIMLSAARGATIHLEWARSYETGQTALRESGPYNAVLVDYDLGLYSGIDLIKEFSSQGYPAPFILFTGRGTYEVDLQAMDAGTTLYLTKAEANSLLLERVIRYAIERKQSEEALRQANDELFRVNLALVEQLAERERAEKAVAESEKKYRDLVENLSEGVWVVDEVGDTVYINRQMADMLGYTIEEMAGKNLAAFLDADGAGRMAADLETRKKGLKEQMEQTFISKDGVPVHTLLTTAPLYSEGKFAGAIAGVLDITDRRRINQVLTESEERFRSTVESMLDGVAIFSTIRQPENADGGTPIVDFSFKYVNQKGCEFENKSTDELVGHSLRELDHHLVQGKNFQRLANVVESGQPAEFRITVEEDGTRKGDQHCNTYEVRAFKSGDGLAVTWRDITQPERLAERLRRREQEARQQLAEIEAIYRTAPVGLCHLDRNLRYLRINDKLAEINGIPAGQHLGHTVRELLPGIADQVEAVAEQVFSKGEAVLNVEVQGETPAQPGVKREWLEHWYPIFASEGVVAGVSVVAEEVTERRRSRRALMENEQRYRGLFESMQEGVVLMEVIFDEAGAAVDYLITDLNPASEAAIGVQRSGIIGHRASEFAREFRFLETFSRVATDGEPVAFETFVPELEKHFRIAAFSPSKGLVCTISADITARKMAETEILESREKFKAVSDLIPVGVSILGSNREMRYANPALARIMGVTMEELIEGKLNHKGYRRPDGSPLPPEEFPSSVVFREQCSVENVEVEVIKAGGEPLWLNVSAVPLPFQDWRVVVISSDITRQKQADKELRQSAQKLRFHIENAPVAVIEWDANLAITSWSGEAESIFGWSEGEVLGKKIMQVPIIHEDDIHLVEDVVEKLTDGNNPRVVNANRNYTKDGEVICCEWYNSVLLDDNGKMKSVLSLALDVTERERAREELLHNAAKLKRSNLALEQFTYIASHDLQEPLRKIRSFSTQLSKHYADALDAEGLDWLDRMCKATQRMEDMISSLLEYARITSQERPFTEVDLTQVTHDAIADLDMRIQQVDGSVQIEPLPTIQAEPAQMRQLMQNLIGNALKFTRKGIPPVVHVSSRSGSPGFVEILVQDNGIGFDPTLANKIFQPFRRLHGRSEYEGTGIGLAICQRIVERHGGHISAEGHPGEGSTFIVSLPVLGPSN